MPRTLAGRARPSATPIAPAEATETGGLAETGKAAAAAPGEATDGEAAATPAEIAATSSAGPPPQVGNARSRGRLCSRPAMRGEAAEPEAPKLVQVWRPQRGAGRGGARHGQGQRGRGRGPQGAARASERAPRFSKGAPRGKGRDIADRGDKGDGKGRGDRPRAWPALRQAAGGQAAGAAGTPAAHRSRFALRQTRCAEGQAWQVSAMRSRWLRQHPQDSASTNGCSSRGS